MQYETLVQEDRVHASLYTGSQIFEDELEKIFYKVWVFVGHESEIPNAGDFLTRTIGRQPVIMSRGKDQNISVFLNRCAHRGTAVCPVERGNTKYFVCPYHGWTYDLNGSLSGVPYPGAYGQDFKKEDHGLPRAARCDSYRGFIFVSLSPEGPSLDEHLGKAKKLIDRSCDLSPQGEIQLSAGWLKHRYHSNWKIIAENDTDGYHLGITHRAFLRVVGTQYARFVGEEDSIKAVLRDWGNGHSEIEWAPGYQRPFDWCGGGSETKFATYLSAMEKSHGKAVTQQRIFDGPAHAFIFPNLFLGEMNILFFEASSVDEAVHWHTPMFLKGVPEFNKRLLRQSEGAMGPASFILPEDVTVAGRNQIGLQAQKPDWLDLRRGMDREEVDSQGRRVSHFTDETTNRGFWRHYRHLMTQA